MIFLISALGKGALAAKWTGEHKSRRLPIMVGSLKSTLEPPKAGFLPCVIHLKRLSLNHRHRLLNKTLRSHIRPVTLTLPLPLYPTKPPPLDASNNFRYSLSRLRFLVSARYSAIDVKIPPSYCTTCFRHRMYSQGKKRLIGFIKHFYTI